MKFHLPISVRMPVVLGGAVETRIGISFEGNFSGYIASLVRSDLAGVSDVTPEEFYPLMHMGGRYRDRVDEEISLRFAARASTLRPREIAIPAFLLQTERRTA